MEVSTVVNNAVNSINAARNSLVQEEVVERTRRLFRRRRFRREGESRGRKGNGVWKCLIFLMSKSNDDFIPTAAEKNRLQRCGFGYPNVQLSQNDRYPTKSTIELGSLEELEDKIVDLYPNINLRLSGFVYAKSDQGRHLKVLDPHSTLDIRNAVGQGKLFIIPKRDLRIPSDVNSVQREQQSPGPEEPPESPIEFINPPSRELEEDQPIHPHTSATTTSDGTHDVTAATTTTDVTVAITTTDVLAATTTTDVTAALPVIRRRRLRLRRERSDTSYTDIDTPGEVAIRRSSAIRARETIRQNARVLLSGEMTPETPSTEGSHTPEMSPLLLDITESPTASAQGSQMSPLSSLQAALDRLDAVFSDTQQITVRRDNVFEDVMELYKDPGILQHRLGVTFAGESGEDAGGLTKDLFSSFWEQACVRYFTGEDVLVPHLPPHRFAQASSIYTVLGRILCHGLALTKVFPLQICRTVLISTALGQIVNDQKILLEDFLLFVSEHERALTQKGLDSFTTLTPDEHSQLTDMFARFSMSVIPTQDNFRQHIENLAACELTGKPLFLCQLMGSGIPEIYKDVFFHQVTQDDLVSLCERLKPTPSRVIGLLKTEHDLLRPDEERVMYFLKDFVYSLSSEDLSRFLQFVTGSCVMPTSGGITVCFHHAQGLLRYPIGRTCGNVISLPIEYDTLQEFKREFLRIIRNDESFRMFVT